MAVFKPSLTLKTDIEYCPSKDEINQFQSFNLFSHKKLDRDLDIKQAMRPKLATIGLKKLESESERY